MFECVRICSVSDTLRRQPGPATIPIYPGAACLAGERQLSAATRAQSALNEALEAAAGGFGLDAVSVCLDDALDALYALTGERADEAVIDGVFEKFCVGK